MAFTFASAPIKKRARKAARIGWNQHAQHREVLRLQAENALLQRQVTQLQLDNDALTKNNNALERLLDGLLDGNAAGKRV